jgi:hypothetical protein
VRKLSGAAVVVIVGIAFYFAVAWGYEGLRMMTSPSYGLDDVWRSQFIFGIGSLFGLEPLGLLKLAAFFAAVKLAVAGFCAVHVVDRLRALAAGKADSEILEGGLILVVLISILSAGPAVWSSNAGLLREATIQLLLAAVGTALCVFERSDAETKRSPLTDLAAAAPRGASWYSPFR